jgi:hypothetical protein
MVGSPPMKSGRLKEFEKTISLLASIYGTVTDEIRRSNDKLTCCYSAVLDSGGRSALLVFVVRCHSND